MPDDTAYEGLATISKDGVPNTRMASAQDATSRIQFLLRAEMKGRTQRRALVKGLVDGNPPYRAVDMRNAGRAHQCNVNWRIAEYYLNHARSAFYDIFSEAPTYYTIRTAQGNANQRELWSRIITTEFDRMLREDRSCDYSMQISQYEMILYGAGPLMFDDDIDWRNAAVLNRDCIVPDYTKSDTTQWEELVIRRDYAPDKLYGFIRNEKVAFEQGWDISATRKAIMEAHPKTQEGGQYYSWEWHQQQLKNNSFGYTSQCKVISVSHYYFKEFPKAGETEGRITHTILVNPEDNQTTQQDKYLFQHIGRFKNWDQIIFPMYYDNDGGGYHHSVTGLGTKMYSAMEYQNRLLCNLADKVFSPKILFKPTTASVREKLSIAQFAEYGQVPAGFDVLQTPIGSFIEDGVVLNREITGLVASNLSQYNAAEKQKSGNPITAKEAEIDASEQARLGKTQLNHYYGQLDRLGAEKFRRATCPHLNGLMPGGHEAVQFIARCLKQGVPRFALQNIESVKATRIIGQGSQFMRQQALEKMLGTVALWPSEAGRNNLLSDFIAANAGQAMVERYNPQIETGSELEDQKAFATLQISAAKDGVAPVVTGTQNHFLFATIFLQAGAQAAQSLEQGGDPAQVFQFIETIGPAIAQHLQYLKGDPTRANAYKKLEEQWKQLAGFHDKLGKQLQKMAQQQAEAQQMQQQAQAIQQGQDPELQLKQAEQNAKLAMAQQKTDAGIAMKQQKQEQGMVLADVSTAHSIKLKNVEAANKPKKESSD